MYLNSINFPNKLDSLKKTNLPNNVKLAEFRDFISTLVDKLEVYGNDVGLPVENQLERYLELAEGTIPLRDEFIQSFLLVPYIEGSHRVVAECLERVAVNIYSDHSLMQNIRKNVLHELFVYLIAIYFKTQNYDALSYTINRTYFGSVGSGIVDGHSFNIFYNSDKYLDKAVELRNRKKYHCGTANFWIEHINVDACSKAEFVFADELCYNAAMLIQNYEDSGYWFPQTYVYSVRDDSIIRTFSVKLKSKEHLAVASSIFGYTSMAEFVAKFKEVETLFRERKINRYRYNSAFETAPVLCDFIKTEELGTRN